MDNLILLANINFHQLAVTANPTINAATKKYMHAEALQRLCDYLEQIRIIPSSLPATITDYLKEVKDAQSIPLDSKGNYDYLDPNKLSQNDIDTALLLVRDALLLPINNIWIKVAHQDLANLIGKVCKPQLSYVPRP